MTRSWRGVPADARQSERRRLLVGAAFELLGSHGWPGTTVRRVCEVARLNPRYFYESFDDLDSLLLAVYDDLIEAVTDVGVRAAGEASRDPAAQARAVIGALVRYVTDDPRRVRVLAVEALGNERLTRRRLDTMHVMAGLAARHGEELYGTPPKGERIGTVAAHLLVGGLAELLVAWTDGQLDLSLDELIDDTAELVIAFAEATSAIAAGRKGRRRRAR